MAEGEKTRQYPSPLHVVLPWDALVQTGLCGPTRNQACPLGCTALAVNRKFAVKPARGPVSLTRKCSPGVTKGYRVCSPNANPSGPSPGPSLLSWRPFSSWHLSRATALPFPTWLLLCPDTLPIELSSSFTTSTVFSKSTEAWISGVWSQGLPSSYIVRCSCVCAKSGNR